jgi:hypothetical protein
MKTRGVVSVAQSIVSVLLLVACVTTAGFAQQTETVVPTMVNFSGILRDGNGKPLTGIVGVTFYLYKDEQAGAPLWMETQNVQPDKYGNYTVQLGSTTSQGLPATLFVSGEARWLGVQAQGQAEQPRVMLMSVPYAMKAGDAQTIGGLPASAFMLAAPGGSPGLTTNSPSPSAGPAPNLAGTGTTDFIPLWTNSTTLGSSVLFQSGTGSTAKVGINTTTPATTLDVKGTGTIRGSLSILGTALLPAAGTATASGGKNSQPLNLAASAFNSSTSKAVNQTFQFRAEPAGNDTSTPSGTLNLLFGSGTSNPSETGLHIASNGQITFASGQMFPGTGNGTITGVTAGTGLSGGGNTGNVNLAIAKAGVGTAQLSAAGSSAGQVLASAGSAVTWQNLTATVPDPLSLTQGSITPTITAVNSTSNPSIFGVSGSGSGLSLNGGVRGDADTVPGILGTSGTAAGVYGQSFFSYGVYGKAGGNDAVHGDTTSFFYSGVAGTNANGGPGVSGSSANGGPGVSGTSDSGPGVLGSSASGYAFSSSGHATQAPAMGGWVKAMVLVDPNSQPPIVLCFNSQLPASEASTPPCGVTYSRTIGPGGYILDFGFPVGQRFYSLTPAYTNLTPSVPNGPLTACISPGVCGPLTDTQVMVMVGDSSSANDSAFYLIIY